jgi:hypothetical protein
MSVRNLPALAVGEVQAQIIAEAVIGEFTMRRTSPLNKNVEHFIKIVKENANEPIQK